MSWDTWVIDATIATPRGLFCFCPVDGDINGEHSIVTGMNVLSDTPPGRVVAIVHEDGQAAVEKWAADNADLLSRLHQEEPK